MNLMNIFTLTIRAFDFHQVAQKPHLLAKLRSLTLHKWSGMNQELDFLQGYLDPNLVRAKIILAYRSGELVAWALLNKEESGNFDFVPEDGYMFQVFVSQNHRRTGIASALFKRAKKLAKKETICVVPWSDEATDFYDQIKEDNLRYL
jgi:GNAT superfamily N-acetyltransferase